MATAKTIQQLDPATGVSLTDQLALAQATGQEARRGSVSQLVSSVAEALSTGALAELEYATAQGKNAIATALTNKGVQSTAADTLIQMADKVNNLEVDTTTENIVGRYSTTSNPTVAGGSQYGKFFRNMFTGDMVITKGSVLYFTPQGDYDSIDDIIAGATHTVDLSAEGLSFEYNKQSAVSEDFTKFVLPVDDAGKYRVYSLDKTTGFTQLYEFTNTALSTNVSDGFSIGIRNDGRYIFYTGSGSKLYYLDATTGNGVEVPNGANTVIGMCLVKDSTVFIVHIPSLYSSVYRRLKKISYSVSEDGTLSFGAMEASPDSYSSEYISTAKYGGIFLHTLGSDQDVIVIYGDPTKLNYTGTHAIGFAQLWAWSFKDITTSKPIRSTNIDYSQCGGYNNSVPYASLSCATYVSGEEGYYNLRVPFFDATIKVNKSTGVTTGMALSKDSNKIYVGYGISGSIPQHCIYANNATGKIITSTSGNTIGTAPYYNKFSLDEKLVAKKRKINGKTAFYDPGISQTELASGAYDLSTTITPAVPDEA
nr:MAG TPA: hypothetical protein [Caudoviricetes sp.]